MVLILDYENVTVLFSYLTDTISAFLACKHVLLTICMYLIFMLAQEVYIFFNRNMPKIIILIHITMFFFFFPSSVHCWTKHISSTLNTEQCSAL